MSNDDQLILSEDSKLLFDMLPEDSQETETPISEEDLKEQMKAFYSTAGEELFALGTEVEGSNLEAWQETLGPVEDAEDAIVKENINPQSPGVQNHLKRQRSNEHDESVSPKKLSFFAQATGDARDNLRKSLGLK